MAVKYHHIFFKDIFSDCQDLFLDDDAFKSFHPEPLTPMKIWIYVCFQVSSGILNSSYKIRAIVERAINHFKTNMCITGRKTRSPPTTKADVFLAGIASQLNVIVAYAMNCPQYIRSLKPLIA